MVSLFDRIGGFGTLSKIVLAFYDRVLDDDVLSPYFADVDMRRLIDHQTKFVAYLMGGPASYTDEHLRLAHARLGIDAAAFERMTLVLRETLEDFGLTDRDVSTVMGQVRQRRDIIVAGAPARPSRIRRSLRAGRRRLVSISSASTSCCSSRLGLAWRSPSRSPSKSRSAIAASPSGSRRDPVEGTDCRNSFRRSTCRGWPPASTRIGRL